MRRTEVIQIDEDNVAQGLQALVLALVEVIAESLKLQAIKRMDAGSLTPDKVEALGRTLSLMDEAVARIKADLGVTEAVASVRESLDNLAADALDALSGMDQWEEITGRGI